MDYYCLGIFINVFRIKFFKLSYFIVASTDEWYGHPLREG